MSITSPPARAADAGQLDQCANPGLDGVVAATTRLSHVDGAAGQLTIAGFPLEALAGHATFEDVLWLLWFDRPPAPAERAGLHAALAARRTLPPATLALLIAAAAAGVAPMDALRMAAATLDLPTHSALDGPGGLRSHPGQDAAPADGTPAQPMASSTATTAVVEGTELPEDALGIVARLPTAVAAYARLAAGREPVPARADLGHAAHLLWSLGGVAPAPSDVLALDTYLVTVSDHGFNASTFTARVIASTGSDMVSALTGAIGALKGPLHGGAPGPALALVHEVGTPERAEAVIRAKLAVGERLMGFGHRIYRVRDPRADVLGRAAEALLVARGETELLELARAVESTAQRLLAEHKPDRAIRTNVEFYTALLLHGLGLSPDQFTPVFAVGRSAGWTAHVLEQRREGRLIRPQSAYVGAEGRRWHGASGKGGHGAALPGRHIE